MIFRLIDFGKLAQTLQTQRQAYFAYSILPHIPLNWIIKYI